MPLRSGRQHRREATSRSGTERAVASVTRANAQPDAPSGVRPPEPRWPALIAILGVGGLYLSLHTDLVIGPRWLFPAAIGVLLVPTLVTHRTGRHDLNRLLGLIISAVVTAGLVLSVTLLVAALPSHRQSPSALLLSAASLWLTNILVFALWYWRLDAGGPYGRDSRLRHAEGAFLFPQMTIPPGPDDDGSKLGWSPHFVDYLFLAFNTSTAFSPTDTPALARWAKAMMMLQSMISLTVLAILAARAVNML
ncbi:MAG: hypothetical protein ABJA98_00815 [Acidobacteriota bacterium]